MDWNTLVIPVALALSILLTLALGWLAIRYASWITEKVKSARLEGILLRLGDAAFKVVRELQQTVVDELKKGDNWNEEKAKEVKEAAIAKLKEYIGPKGVQEALTILGLDTSGLDKLIGTLIEAEVHDLRAEAKDDA
jgi:hypothetical protein